MVFRAIWEEQKISHAPFVMLLSPRAFQLEHLLIFLEEMFSDKRDRMLELVNQNFNWARWFCHRSFLPSPVKGTEELVCSWAHSLGSAQQARGAGLRARAPLPTLGLRASASAFPSQSRQVCRQPLGKSLAMWGVMKCHVLLARETRWGERWHGGTGG
jgi:hypothetical protein